jgi:hypothetical protein
MEDNRGRLLFKDERENFRISSSYNRSLEIFENGLLFPIKQIFLPFDELKILEKDYSKYKNIPFYDVRPDYNVRFIIIQSKYDKWDYYPKVLPEHCSTVSDLEDIEMFIKPHLRSIQ